MTRDNYSVFGLLQYVYWVKLIATKTTREALPYDEQLQCEVPPKSKYSSRFLV